LETLGIEDPRILYYDDSAVLLDDVDFSIIVPFYEELAGVNVYNGTTDERLIIVEIEPAIGEFCTSYPNDPSCTGAARAAPTPAPLPWGLAVLSCIAAALIGMHWKRES
ncbi:MAG: hypothetical protein RQ758_07965, partial [Methanomicrobiaceae archaeon]|nr:hypothetical protein [Methanomicrobiaceae archaeon]